MGDGVALWQFHSKQNSIDDALIDSGHAALELVADGRCRALVIGNDGARFSIGYNLALALQRIKAGEFDALERSVQRLQQLALRLRQAPVPVVAAAAGMALGGGMELLLAANHGHRAQRTAIRPGRIQRGTDPVRWRLRGPAATPPDTVTAQLPGG